jgi:hypothetical protein
MLLAFATFRHVQAKTIDSGRFWCLNCETERDFERRTWAATRAVFFMPVASSRGEFILCKACESAFDPECLDESSTASCDELLLDVPHAAVRARTRPQVSLAEYLEQGD